MLPVRVLLVDDNEEFLRVGQDLLNEDFSVVGTVSDGASVSAEVQRLQPDVLVLDLSLGDMSGFEVAKNLITAGTNCHIVFLTVHEGYEFVRAARLVGVSGYVFKARAAQDLPIAVLRAASGLTFFPANEFLAG